MIDKIVMKWTEGRLAPVFEVKFGNKKFILVLDNLSYHHGYDVEVRVRKRNIKKCYGDWSIISPH